MLTTPPTFGTSRETYYANKSFGIILPPTFDF